MSKDYNEFDDAYESWLWSMDDIDDWPDLFKEKQTYEFDKE